MINWDHTTTTDHWNFTEHFEAVGWSFGLFGLLTPELLWLICRSEDPDLEHPDVLPLLYVLRVSSQCDGRQNIEGSALTRYLEMQDWDELIDLETMLTGDTSEEWDTTEKWEDDEYM
jgi:hypothetical protein